MIPAAMSASGVHAACGHATECYYFATGRLNSNHGSRRHRAKPCRRDRHGCACVYLLKDLYPAL